MQNFLDLAKERLPKENFDVVKEFYDKVLSLCKSDEQLELLDFGLQNTVIIFPLELDYDMIFAGIILPLLRKNQLDETQFADYQSALELANTVLKIEAINLGDDANVEDVRSMLVAMAKDIRVIILKLADALNNARHLKRLTDSEKSKLHKDIVDIYVPLASRLGISYIKSELQDLDLSYTQPNDYKKLMKELAEGQEERKKQIEHTIEEIKSLLAELKINGEVYGRLKHVSSVFNKIKQKNYKLDGIYDLSAIRILVDSINECYSVLGVVHTKYQPIDGRFKDYIAKPKANGYQSLHTTVLIDGKPLEIQIRTHDMHLHAEYGIAAHFLYKEHKKKINNLDDRLISIKKMLENPNLTNAQDIITLLKSNVYDGEIFVQSPMGKIINLPEDSTPIDFAYVIHSNIGNKCVGAKVNGKMVPLNTKLNNGDIVEIITSANAKGPSRDWLKIAVTSGAKNKINAFFKKEMRDENIKKGKLMLEQSAKVKGVDLKELIDDKLIVYLLDRYSLKNIEDMYAMIGSGSLTTTQVINRLILNYEEVNKVEKDFVIKPSTFTKKEPDKSSIAELESMMLKFAHCCDPIPGDEIVGFISRGRGVTIHRKDCKSIKSLEQSRLMPLTWSDQSDTTYVAKLRLIVKDASGSLASIINKISEQKLNIAKIDSKPLKLGKAIVDVSIFISNTKKLDEVVAKLQALDNVLEIYRGEN
ncbi:MAG: RelA/SpoT family protein [Christensenellales bacterium]